MPRVVVEQAAELPGFADAARPEADVGWSPPSASPGTPAGDDDAASTPVLDRAPDRPEPPTELIPGYDLEGEEMYDVAPIAATTFLGRQAPESGRPGSDRPAPPSKSDEPTVQELERQIRELEAKLDRMIRAGARNPDLDEPPGAGFPEATRAASAQKAGPRAARNDSFDDDVIPEPAPSGSMLETAREILSTDYVLRQWGKLGLRNRSEEVDDFGLDPKYEARFRPMLDFLYDVWFRVDTEGAANIPDEGRCIVVANHSGGPLPYDGLMLRTTVRREHPRQRDLRWLAEDFIYYLPFVGAFMNRVGAVRACQENAERLLARGRAVAVFPEGIKGIGKLYRDRYKLQRFGRGGFIRLCLRTQTPLVPCAVVGAEESSPMLYKVESMAKVLGIPYLPITPTFPAFGPLGLLPAPTKWKVRFGEPIRFDDYGPGAVEDEVLVARLTERVRTTIQSMLDRALGERKSVWFG